MLAFAHRLSAHYQRYFFRYSLLALLGLIGWSWWFILLDQPDAVSSLFQRQNWDFLTEFVGEMLGVGEKTPAFLDLERWQNALWLSLDTFLMSLLATAMATAAMLLFVLPAVKNFAQGNQTTRGDFRSIFCKISNGLFLVSRAVPELMWAMMLVFIFQPGILPGALALAIHNFGILGKLCAEAVENMDDKPLNHLRQNGASPSQLLFYGIYPMVIGTWLNYILYRMENIIRATLIVGFVGASGLGLQFKLAMSYFHYSDITLYLLCYLLLVYLTDGLSALVKKYLADTYR